MLVEAQRLATYEDLLGLPDTVIGEIVEGQLVTTPRSSGRHALASSMLSGSLVPRFGFGDDEGPGEWLILFEPELHFENDVLVPDLAGWRRERLPSVAQDAAIETVPDWTCEILSPSTARTDRVRKMPAYARHGVAFLWLIDPSLETLEVFLLQAGHWLLAASHSGDEVVRAVPFDAVELPLRRLWAR